MRGVSALKFALQQIPKHQYDAQRRNPGYVYFHTVLNIN